MAAHMQKQENSIYICGAYAGAYPQGKVAKRHIYMRRIWRRISKKQPFDMLSCLAGDAKILKIHSAISKRALCDRFFGPAQPSQV